MDMVNKSGQMVLVMKVNGKRIKHQEKVHLLMQMVINMKVIGKMIKHMDMEYLFMQNHVLDIKDIGKMI